MRTFSQPTAVRLNLRWLAPAVLGSLVGAWGNGHARADELAPSGGARLVAVRHEHYCRCAGCQGGGSCCCAEKSADETPPAPEKTGEPATGAIRPCLKAAPCGDAPLPAPGSLARVGLHAMTVEPVRRDANDARRSFDLPESLSFPGGWIAPLDDPPESLR